MGVVAAIKRVAGSSAILFEIASPGDLQTRIKSYQPDVLVINPLFAPGLDVAQLRANPDLDLADACIVALLSTPPSRLALAAYDNWLSIYDSENDIQSLLDALSKAEPAKADSDDDDEQLSAREKEVVRYVVKGLPNKEIADVMNISLFTVLTHRRNISRKLKIHSSIALAIYAISNKIATVDEVK